MAKKGKPKAQANVDNATTTDTGTVANMPRGKKPKKVYE